MFPRQGSQPHPRVEDAAGMPYVPAPVLHREGLVGPPPTQEDQDVSLALGGHRGFLGRAL